MSLSAYVLGIGEIFVLCLSMQLQEIVWLMDAVHACSTCMLTMQTFPILAVCEIPLTFNLFIGYSHLLVCLDIQQSVTFPLNSSFYQ